MEKRATPPDDDYQIRCPRLGHQVPFSYCRVESENRPCFKIMDCWNSHFKVDTYLQSELTSEQFKQVLNKTIKPKILSLVELVEQAKQSKKKGS